MNVKQLIAILQTQDPELKVQFAYEYDAMQINRESVDSVVFENDGLREPALLLMPAHEFDKYDEDYEHGVKLD